MSRKMTITDNQLKVFETVPDLYLILSPDLHILTASNAYLEATLTVREAIVGKTMFEVFPDNPSTPQASSVANLNTSLQEVLATKKPHQMALQRYDVPQPEQKAEFEEKYWQPINIPILDEEENILYILHKAIDVTQKIKNQHHIQELTAREQTAQQETEGQRQLLHKLFMEAPAPIVILDGEQLVYQLVNPAYQQIFPGRELLGKPVLEALPEVKDTPIPAILNKVYRTGESFVAQELMLMMARHEGAPLEEIYWTFTYQARRNQQGAVDGILVYAHEVTEQVKARKKIEESEHQVRSIIESSPFPLGVFFGKEMRIQFANKAIQDSMGKGPDVIGKLYRDVLPELENQGVFEELERVFETGIPFHSRNNPIDLLINGQLQTFYFNYSLTPLFNAAGEVYGIINSGADETELILAQQRVEESELRFRNLVEQAPVAIGLTRGKDHFIEEMNTPMLRIVGKNREEAVGKRLTEAMPEIKDDFVLNILNTVLETGEAYSGNEVSFTYKAEEKLELHYLNVSYTPLMEEGDITGIIHVAVDVTEQVEGRKKIEEGQEELKRFKFMADEARDPFILMRKDGSFAYLNKKALEAWGYTEEEIEHLRVPDADPVYQQEAFLQLFARAQKEAIPQFETLHKTKEGRIFPVEVNVVGLTIGETPYLFAIARDITHRKQVEEAMKVSNAELRRTNNDLDNFIYTASHDLKAPISNIEALLHALLRTLPPKSLASDRSQRITSMMQESVERFKKTIANLTEIVKLQKENSGEELMLNLSEVIKDVRLDLEQLIQGSGAQIEVDVSDCPTIHFSKKNLRSVVYNLLSNAIKYRAPERVPRVQISCKSVANYQVLSVKDNGLGMDPRRFDQLYTMFKRFHSHVEGTGIGLYMVKKMVDNAGGRIEVESQLGKGTTFHVYFKR